MDRRRFVASSLLSGAAALAERAGGARQAGQPIVDAHVHLFDPTRAGGVPWPKPTDSIYRPALPERLRSLAAPLGVTGAIAIEASPLRSDNDWLLAQVTRNPFMVGMIGNLQPGSETFAGDLERLHASPLFLGIRYGNLWDRDLAVDGAKPEFVADLRRLTELRLTFESANPTPGLLVAILRVAHQVPGLCIVVDHVPHMDMGADAEERAVVRTLEEMSRAPGIFMKMSEVLRPTPGRVQTSSAPYRERLDLLWDMFGPERMLFGSDWPNSDPVAPYREVLRVAEDYVKAKSPAAFPDVFFRTSQRAYRWRARVEKQERWVAVGSSVQ